MNVRRTVALFRKELIQTGRDPRSLMIILLLPLIQIVLLGYGARLDADNIPVYVLDQEGSQNSQALLKAFQASPYFNVVKVVPNYRDLVRAIDSDRCKLAVVIPWNFSQSLNDGHTAKIQALLDGTDNNSARLAQGYASAVVNNYATKLQLAWFARHGLAPGRLMPPLTIEYRTWFNEDLESKNFIIPGTVALVMALMGALLSSLTIAREWERGTMEQLIASPVSPLEIMVGKLLPYVMIGLFDAGLCGLLAVGWFGVPFRGTLFAFFFVTLLFLLVILGIGYIISVWTRNQVAASEFALLVTLLPTAMLSGFAFPIDQMPTPIRALSYVVYSRYYVSALKRIFLAGSPLGELLPEISALTIYAVVIGFFAVRVFHKRLQ
jgi:ABC-2 type transport system permease protein